MRNAKREPLTNEQRHQLLDAIDAAGGIDSFSAAVPVERTSIGRALTGGGVLPSTGRLLKEAAESYVFGLAARARREARP